MNIGTIGSIPIPQNRKVNLQEATIMKEIVKDETFCKVKIIKYQDQFYVLKIINKKDIPEHHYEEEYYRIENEINALYHLHHPNIIQLFYHEETEDDIKMLMEYGGKKLWSVLTQKQLTEDQTKEYLKSILLAVKDIHENGYIHRDLSPENILITRENEVKIIDFGFCNQVRGRKTKIGTFFYMAPEITGDDIYNHKVDIWSIGVIVYEMLHQDLPFCSRKEFDEQSFEENFIQKRNQLQISFRPGLSPEVIDFMKKTIVIDPEKRANIENLLKHPFIEPRRQSRAESESSFFDQLNQTERIERKTQKNNPYLRQKDERQSEDQKEGLRSGIRQQQMQFRQSLCEVFACLHHEKDVFSELLKTYQDLLQKQIVARNNQT